MDQRTVGSEIFFLKNTQAKRRGHTQKSYGYFTAVY